MQQPSSPVLAWPEGLEEPLDVPGAPPANLQTGANPTVRGGFLFQDRHAGGHSLSKQGGLSRQLKGPLS